jgi:hypothetical protein
MLNAATNERAIHEQGGVAVSSQPERSEEVKPVIPWLEFVSLSVVSITNDRISATIKLKVDGVTRTFEHTGGVGPVNAICVALRELEPDLRDERCWTEEPLPRSDAMAIAKGEIKWRGVAFRGEGRDLNTLDASAKSIIDAMNKIPKFVEFLDGRKPLFESEQSSNWAGFLVLAESIGGSAGSHRGEREMAYFQATYDPEAGFTTEYKGNPKGKRKQQLSKGWHHSHEYDLVRCTTKTGHRADLFLTKRTKAG